MADIDRATGFDPNTDTRATPPGNDTVRASLCRAGKGRVALPGNDDIGAALCRAGKRPPPPPRVPTRFLARYRVRW